MASDPNFKQLLDSLNTAVLVVDRQLCLRHLNSAAEMLLEVSSAQMQGAAVGRCFDDADTALESLRNNADTLHTYTKRRARWQLHNGRELTVDYSVTPTGDDGGLLIEIQPLDRLLRISRDEALMSAQETTRNLVRSMAHEIKNPLGGIRGAAQLLARELPDDRLEEYTRIIIDEADRLRNLVDKMLGPRQPMQWQPVNVHEVLERVAAILSAECAGRLQIARDYDPSIPDLPGDKEQLIQAVLNIVRNSVQALQEGDMLEQGCITLQTRIQRQFTIGRRHHPLVVRLAVIDNGPGIPDTLLQDIFYPMISGRPEGSGLGLAISQQLVNQHRGLIECESRPGRTQFFIYLPLQAEQHDA